MRERRRAETFVAVAVLAVMAAPGLIQTASEVGAGERPGALDVFYQPPTARNLHGYERSLEDNSLVVRRLRPWAQYVQWTFLADAGDEAVVGRQGWLFYRPSVRYVTGRATDAGGRGPSDALAAIRSFRDQLQARGTRLLLVPVPGKESIYPERLAGRAQGAGVVVCEPTRRLLDELDRYGVEYVDLFAEFRRVKRTESRSGPPRLYLAQDSHWSPEGARLAAAAVARRVLNGDAVGRGKRPYAERPVTVRRLGDLIRMIRVPQIERAMEPEALSCLQVVDLVAGTNYRDTPDSDVLVLGDSFLRIYEQEEPGSAGFVAHLARELGRPLASVVSDGGGSTLVRQQVARQPGLLTNKRLLIWEFAERDVRFGTQGWKIVTLPRTEATAARSTP
jgi:hypothetical protein